MTRKELNGYIRYKQEIKLLETELEEMKNTDVGLGNDTVFDYRSGYPKPQSVVGFDEKSMKIEKRDLTSEFVKFGKLRTGSRKSRTQKSD